MTLRRSSKFWVALICGAGAATVLYGFGHYDTAEIRPGEADYPVSNPAPRQIVHVSAVMPEGYYAQANAGYVATAFGGTISSGKYCGREVGLAVTASFYHNIPVPLVRSGTTYRGEVTVDRYLPGRCGWSFQGLRIELLKYGERPQANEQQMGANFPYRDSSIVPVNQHSDYWCFQKFCTNLAILLGDGKVGRTFVASVPSAHRGTGDAVFIGSDTMSLTADFHDLDSVDPRRRLLGGADPDAIKKTPGYRALQCFSQANSQYVRTHRPLPDSATQAAAVAEMRRVCRAKFGLPPLP